MKFARIFSICVMLAACSEFAEVQKNQNAVRDGFLINVRFPGEDELSNSVARTVLPGMPTVLQWELNASRNGSTILSHVMVTNGQLVSANGTAYAPLAGDVLNLTYPDAAAPAAQAWITVTEQHIATGVINATLTLLSSGRGTIALPIDFYNGFPHDTGQNIVRVESYLYHDFDDYQYAANPLRENTAAPFAASPQGTSWSRVIVQFNGSTIQSGARFLKSIFYRANGSVAKILVESVLVRDNLASTTWINPGTGLVENKLTLDKAAFDWSDATLNNINITLNGTQIPIPTTGSPFYIQQSGNTGGVYQISYDTINLDKLSFKLLVNGVQQMPAAMTDSFVSYNITTITGVYMLSITMLASDGITKNIYRFEYDYYSGSHYYYVSATGNDGNTGIVQTAPFATVSKALSTAGQAFAVIEVLDEITESIMINNNSILLKGSGTVKYSSTVLTLADTNSQVTLSEGITLKSMPASAQNNQGVVCVQKGKLSMNGGLITGGKVRKGGGGVEVSSGAAFVMTGGEISGNVSIATVNGEGGGGVLVTGSTARFDFSGGIIKENTSGTLLTSPTGGGGGGGITVANGAAFLMTGTAVLSKNSAYYGGGLYVIRTTNAELADGTISENEAREGGGINVSGDYVSLQNQKNLSIRGGILRGNNAIDGGGAISLYESGIVISGGTLSGNETHNGDGGAVFIKNNSVCHIEGGVITGNKAVAGNAISLTSTGGGLSIRGAPLITLDNDIYLYNSGAAQKKIQVPAALDPSIKIVARITVADNAYTTASKVLETALAGIHRKFIVTPKNGQEYWAVDAVGHLVHAVATRTVSSYTPGYASLADAFTEAQGTDFQSDMICVQRSAKIEAPAEVALGKNITLTTIAGTAITLQRAAAFPGTFFYVNGILHIEPHLSSVLIIDGAKPFVASGMLFEVRTGGSLTMNTCTMLVNNNFAGYGGAVAVNGGIFVMNGGEIRDNEALAGGGVFVNSGAVFYLNTLAGKFDIHNNTSAGSGANVQALGAFYVNGVSENSY
ncbi:MAG: hypothetical protein LBD22_04035 [Spirochaetaceae bacterium]|jgi:hypothetical protein|nr:hypothetical protein [Spirochaetaceae bacterium]